MHLEEELRNYIFNQLVSGVNPKKFDSNYDLIDGGILDSLAIVQLVTHLEEVYQIEMETGEIVAENLSSIRRLVDFVKRKLRNQ